jgi:hypothetical protein
LRADCAGRRSSAGVDGDVTCRNAGGGDVFFVQSILNAGGWSVQTGPCDKSEKGFSGAVLDDSRWTSPEALLGLDPQEIEALRLAGPSCSPKRRPPPRPDDFAQ